MWLSHFALTKIRAAAIWFSCCFIGFFPNKKGLMYLHEKIKLLGYQELLEDGRNNFNRKLVADSLESKLNMCTRLFPLPCKISLNL